jgi:hypothetical protein
MDRRLRSTKGERNGHLNLGGADELLAVDWEDVIEKLDAGSPPLQTPTTLARRGSRQ